jgi:hypothetical protein
LVSVGQVGHGVAHATPPVTRESQLLVAVA